MAWLCEGLDVTRFGFHAWLTHSPSQRSVNDEVVGAKVYARFKASDRTCGAIERFFSSPKAERIRGEIY